jgi:hypothetical protein
MLVLLIWEIYDLGLRSLNVTWCAYQASGIQVLLSYCTINFIGCNIGIADGTDLWSTPFRYPVNFVVVTLRDSCEVRTESRFHFVVVTLCDSCEVRTESRLHFVVVTLCDSCEVRTESRFHFVVVKLCDSCEVRTESRFHFVGVTLSV